MSLRNVKVILTPYNVLIRPNQEYCIQFWSLYDKFFFNNLEKIQRKLIEMISRLRNKSDEEQLKELNLFNLSKYRPRGNLIEIFKNFPRF